MKVFQRLAFGFIGAALVVSSVVSAPVVTFAAEGEPLACGTELIQNGSFESPVLTNPQGWGVVQSGQDGIAWNAVWVDTTPLPGKPAIANVEIQNGRPAQSGIQFTELDSDYDGSPNPLPGDVASVKLYQDIPTHIGVPYTLSFFTAPIPLYGVDENITIVSFGDSAALTTVDTVVEDGTVETTTNWKQHTYTVVPTTTTSRIQFADGGAANSFGSFLDTVSLKEVCDDGGGEGEGGGGSGSTRTISGIVWNDQNSNAVLDGSETGLADWKVFVDSNNNGDIDLGETTVLTNALGNYQITGLSAGVYVVRAFQESFWTQTFPAAEKHVVTVVDANIAAIDFGNARMTSGGSGGGGAPVSSGVVLIPTNAAAPVPTVAGDSTTIAAPTPPATVTPAGQVLGATTQLPRTGLDIALVLAVFAGFAGIFWLNYQLSSRRRS